MNGICTSTSAIPFCSRSTLSGQLGDGHDCPLKMEVSEQCMGKVNYLTRGLEQKVDAIIAILNDPLRPGAQEPVSRKSRKLFGPEKPFVKLRPANSVKLVFSYVVRGIKIKITAKFRASRRLHFEDTKRIMSPEMRTKSFGTFEKRAPVSRKSRNFLGPKSHSTIPFISSRR